MAGVTAGRWVSSLLAGVAACCLVAPSARALEFLDGRIQAHGYGEMQIRGMSSQFQEELDLAMWYNILNVELEFDIASDGWAFFDLIEAYVRLEGRYDCIYTRGCGIFRSADTWGNRAGHIPTRLRDAEGQDYGGVIPTGAPEMNRITGHKPVPPALYKWIDNPDYQTPGTGVGQNAACIGDPYCNDPQFNPVLIRDVRNREGFPGLDTLFDQRGADALAYRSADDPEAFEDDPARYTFEPVLDWRFYMTENRGSDGATNILGPVLPENTFSNLAMLRHKANPYRGERPPKLSGVFRVDSTIDERLMELSRFGPGDTEAPHAIRPRCGTGGIPCSDALFVGETPGNPFDPGASPTHALYYQAWKDSGGTGLFPGVATDVMPVNPADDESMNAGRLTRGDGKIFREEGSFNVDPDEAEKSRDKFRGLAGDFSGIVPRSTPLLVEENYNPAAVPSAFAFIDGTSDLAFTPGVAETIAPPLANPDNCMAAGASCLFVKKTDRLQVGRTVSMQLGVSTFEATITSIQRVGDTVTHDSPEKDTVFLDTQLPDNVASGVDVVCPLCMHRGTLDFLPGSNRAIIAGTGELPMRPAPDRGNLDFSPNPGLMEAQGLYIPSRGLRKVLANDDMDPHKFNISENNRAWNRGASQDDEGELKEGYFEFEFFDSRLWTRLGKQTIVWGKTELFPTTDQFNPQDFSLASLPSLEESRIPLWAGRFIYSLYDVGPLEDVRLEFALNFDEFEPNDLGACGEPYTFDVVCGLTFGIAAHGLLGVGVAGIDRPPDPWESTKGIEFGGRIEWRWGPFSFALVDFYGFTDLPYPDQISAYERNVDLATGRPLIMRLIGEPQGTCSDREDPIPGDSDGRNYSDAGAWQTMTPDGIGRDPDCLKPGGAAGYANENAFDGPGTSPQNALYHHFANQTLFAAICSASIGISSIDPGACAFSALNSENPADNQAAPYQLATFVSSTFSGEPEMNAVMSAITKNPRTLGRRGEWAPLAPLNRDGGTWKYDRYLEENLGHPDAGTPGFPDPENAGHWVVVEVEAEATPRDSVHCTGVDGPGGNLDCDPDDGSHSPSPWSADGRGGIGTDGVITAGFEGINKPFPELLDRFGWDLLNPNTPNAADLIRGETADEYLCVTNDTDGFRDCRVASFYNQLRDFLTLDSTLTNHQRGLLACGPLWGTRCDSSDRVWQRDETTGELVLVVPAGGGIDLLGAEASFLVQSWVGSEGTEVLPEAFLDEWNNGVRHVLNPLLPIPNNQLTNSDGVKPTWLTTSSAMAQPGAISLFVKPDWEEFSPVDLSNWILGGAPPPEDLFRTEMFPLGATCTYYNEKTGALTTLPGCRGVKTFEWSPEQAPLDVGLTNPIIVPNGFRVTFEYGYLPSIDGCVLGREQLPLPMGGGVLDQGVRLAIAGVPVHVGYRTDPDDPDSFVEVTVDLESEEEGYYGELSRQLAACTVDEEYPAGRAPGDPLPFASSTRVGSAMGGAGDVPIGESQIGARTLWHPLAGCRTPGNLQTDARGSLPGGENVPTAVESLNALNGVDDGESCEVVLRDFVQNFWNDPSSVQIFRSEGAALSFNVQMFLAALSCNGEAEDEIEEDPECFDLEQAYRADGCSFAAPQFCRSVKGFLGAGLQRNTVRAGGRDGRGRRTFIWQSGGEAVLRYKKRNVFGFSMDFAEDRTKSNWGLEFTWMASNPFFDNGSMTNLTTSDTLNMTISVDRPTFVNFMNANRTFFVNSQWFFSYITNYKKSFTGNGPFNVLATFAIFTGYYQDRLLPNFVAVYDFRSRSGAFLPQIRYRFTEVFEATLGFKLFYGRTELRDMPVRGLGPAGNQVGPDAYKVGVNNVISNFRKRDEIFMSIRWTF